MTTPPDRPPTRWSRTADQHDYASRFAGLVQDGADISGEARLADTLVPRAARILDVGSGMGRVAEALRVRGHDVVATEPDPDLRAQSRQTYPHLEVLPHEALDLESADLAPFDLVVLVGNVMVYLAEGTERDVLRHLAALLAPDGRILAGFHLSGEARGSRVYPPEEFVADVATSGLHVDHRFGSYDLRPAGDEYAVWLLSRD